MSELRFTGKIVQEGGDLKAVFKEAGLFIFKKPPLTHLDIHEVRRRIAHEENLNKNVSRDTATALFADGAYDIWGMYEEYKTAEVELEKAKQAAQSRRPDLRIVQPRSL